MRKSTKLALVTNSRSDYSTMQPIIREAMADSQIEATILCGGAHLLEKFGNTSSLVAQDSAECIDYVPFFDETKSDLSFVLSLGDGVKAFARALKKHSPDMVVLTGDRIENLSVLAATTAMKIPVAHLCGGDITEGAFDDQVRHAMTKLSHLHFVSMEDHKRRVIQMGEEPWRVVITGDAAIDNIVDFKPLSRKELFNRFRIDPQQKFLIATFHPQTIGGEYKLFYKNLLDSLLPLDVLPVIAYPNIDPGSNAIIEMLEEFKAVREDAVICKSFTGDEYYSLMFYAEFMIGNASSGLWEAPSFKLPAINIGKRQAGRIHTKNVLNVSGYSLEELQVAIDSVLSESFKESIQDIVNPYGSGGAAQLTLSVIKETPFDERLMMKKFHNVDF